MGKGLSIEITGQEAALKSLGNIIERTSNPRGLFDLVGASLVTSTQQRFDRGRGPDGNPWPASIRALTTGGKTLVDTARLLGSLTHNATNTMVEVGTNVIYAAIHQFGGTIKPVSSSALRFKIGNRWVTKSKVEIPARPFLGIDDDDRKEIILIGEDWLREAANAR